MPKLAITDVDVAGRRVLVRVDFNVPMDGGRVTDDTRIRASLPTIQHILKQGGKVILMSHLGRPEGKKNPKYSLAPVAKCLQELIGKPVRMAPDCIGPEVARMVQELKNGDILMLENVRFYPEEEANDEKFARQLAAFGDVFVNDAFGSSHRAHASVAGVARFVPAAAAGFLLQKEVDTLHRVLHHAARPSMTILGGAKVSDKILVIENLLDRTDALFIGGAMAYTFLLAQGAKVGGSRIERDRVDVAKKLLAKAADKKIPVYLPVDHTVARSMDLPAERKIVVGDIEEGWIGLDIGPKTVATFKTELRKAKTVLWNGPLGLFEKNEFALGSRAIAEVLADMAEKKQAEVIIGGGDTAAAVEKFGLARRMTHVSTGGGASLEFLEGKPLPGIAALSDKK